jgi:transcriptional repressor NrdR
MRCAFCGQANSKVLDSRPSEKGKTIRRRRKCPSCGNRFTTYERVEEFPLLVIKRDNRRELFDSAKIFNGLIKACDKLSVPVHVLEDTVNAIEKELRNQMAREVSSREIGELIMQRLKDIDQVAYVRFAAVYRRFADIGAFMGELKQIEQENKRALRKAAKALGNGADHADNLKEDVFSAKKKKIQAQNFRKNPK